MIASGGWSTGCTTIPRSGGSRARPAKYSGKRFHKDAEGGQSMLRRVLIGLAAAAAMALPAAAQDHYVIGLTGAMTGPAAGSLAPAVEGVRLYVERLNAAGGVNGQKVQLILQDDAAEPAEGAAHVKKTISQDNGLLQLDARLS